MKEAKEEEKMAISNVINVVKNVKQICKDYVVLLEIGSFYYCYGKDSFVISYIGKYKINIVQNEIYSCAFPKTAYNKIISKLEANKINYIILDRRNNYEEREKSNNKNLNNYQKYYEIGKKESGTRMRVEKINKYLINNIKDVELIENIERLINERRKI